MHKKRDTFVSSRMADQSICWAELHRSARSRHAPSNSDFVRKGNAEQNAAMRLEPGGYYSVPVSGCRRSAVNAVCQDTGLRVSLTLWLVAIGQIRNEDKIKYIKKKRRRRENWKK